MGKTIKPNDYTTPGNMCNQDGINVGYRLACTKIPTRQGDMRERKPNRLKSYDYSNTGMYFITICIQNRINHFGTIENDKMVLSELGKVATVDWMQIPEKHEDVHIDEFIIMPNHIHGIIVIPDFSEQASLFPTGKMGNPQHEKIPVIIGSYKSGVTRKINATQDKIYFQWQKSYYDHIIRNEDEFNRIRNYIINNPINWKTDDYF